MTHLVFAIYGTDREFVERIEAFREKAADAQAEATRLAYDNCPTRFIRVRVRPVALTVEEIGGVIEGWGWRDARAGLPRSSVDLINHPYKEYYLRGYDACPVQSKS